MNTQNEKSTWNIKRISKILEEINNKNEKYLFHFIPRTDSIGLDKGIETDFIYATFQDNPVGYLEISYTTNESMESLYPTVWHYMFANKKYEFSSLFEDMQLYKTSNFIPIPQKITEEMMLKFNQVKKINPQLIENTKSLMDNSTSWFATPYVAFARVSTNEQRQGLGTLMYELASDIYGGIKSNSLQSGDAQALWKSFEKSSYYISKTDENERTTTFLLKDKKRFENIYNEQLGKPNFGDNPKDTMYSEARVIKDFIRNVDKNVSIV